MERDERRRGGEWAEAAKKAQQGVGLVGLEHDVPVSQKSWETANSSLGSLVADRTSSTKLDVFANPENPEGGLDGLLIRPLVSPATLGKKALVNFGNWHC